MTSFLGSQDQTWFGSLRATGGTSTLNIEHITDYAIVQEHKYENMIVLCANCHGRKTSGEIDRKSLLQYKANVAVINTRYSDVERRVLEVFADQRRQLAPAFNEHIANLANDWPRGISVQLPGTLRMMMMMMLLYLVRDGLVEIAPAGAVIDPIVLKGGAGRTPSPAH